jgi:branched-subunit amino acid transport protein AzlD
MPIPISQSLSIIAVTSLVTIALRFLPFFLFPAHKKTPEYIIYLGTVLPFAIMGMLIIFCLKDVTLFSGTFGVPELLSIVFIIGLHLWKRNTLLSIAGGTILYMLLIQILLPMFFA